MKIISRHRDYYDYLVGYYGFDETIVYDRRNPKDTKIWDRPQNTETSYLFAICGKFVPVFYDGKNFHFEPKSLKLREYNYSFKFKGQKTKINEELRQPVLLRNGYFKADWVIPNLSEYGFPSYFDAHEMYQNIYAFLGWLKDHPEAPQIKGNDDKIRAAGFDTKASFRPNMK